MVFTKSKSSLYLLDMRLCYFFSLAYPIHLYLLYNYGYHILTPKHVRIQEINMLVMKGDESLILSII